MEFFRPRPISNGMKEIYLDFAATTPLDNRVLDEMLPFFTGEFGNPSSLYPLGTRAQSAVERARKTVADILGVRPEEIAFTSGGTEAANLALFGVARKLKSGHIIVSQVEHDAVVESARALGRQGFDVTFLPVDRMGRVSTEKIVRALRLDTILVSVIYANNEIGTVEPITEIGKIIREWKRENKKRDSDPPYFFTDACQAAGALTLQVKKLNVDLLALNGSKIYGPKGVGCLYIRKGVEIEPIVYGGGQERGIRSGTENVPGVVGFARALEIAEKEREKESKRLSELRNYFFSLARARIPGVRINGDIEHRLPNNVNISIAGMEGDTLVIFLGEKGIFASTGSACSSTDLEPSHVLTAIGCPPEYLGGSLRFTLGRATEKKDIDRAINALAEVLSILQKQKK